MLIIHSILLGMQKDLKIFQVSKSMSKWLEIRDIAQPLFEKLERPQLHQEGRGKNKTPLKELNGNKRSIKLKKLNRKNQMRMKKKSNSEQENFKRKIGKF